MKKLLCLFSLFVPLCLFGQETNAQTDSIKSFSMNADFVSRYVWRGILYSSNPNVQPYASFTNKNFTVGAWGSYGISQNYSEFDFYLSYKINRLTLNVSDYYSPLDENDPSLYKYFELDSKKTLHAIEGSALYSITDNFNATLATFFYGNDRDSIGDNNYSTYMELGYSFSFLNTDFSLFAGGAFNEGYYSDKAAVVNTGIAFCRKIEINEKLSIPFSGSLIINPNKETAYFILKITL